MYVSELDLVTRSLVANNRHDVPVYVQTPAGEWVHAKTASVRQKDGETILIVYIDMESL